MSKDVFFVLDYLVILIIWKFPLNHYQKRQTPKTEESISEESIEFNFRLEQQQRQEQRPRLSHRQRHRE
jgi:hypothetical protein